MKMFLCITVLGSGLELPWEKVYEFWKFYFTYSTFRAFTVLSVKQCRGRGAQTCLVLARASGTLIWLCWWASFFGIHVKKIRYILIKQYKCQFSEAAYNLVCIDLCFFGCFVHLQYIWKSEKQVKCSLVLSRAVVLTNGNF